LNTFLSIKAREIEKQVDYDIFGNVIVILKNILFKKILKKYLKNQHIKKIKKYIFSNQFFIKYQTATRTRSAHTAWYRRKQKHKSLPLSIFTVSPFISTPPKK
jgi:hypothetical protein